MPTLHGALIHTWLRTWMFLRKAGTVILAASVILWVLSSYPRPPADASLDAKRQAVRGRFLSEAGALDMAHGGGDAFVALARAELALIDARADHWADAEPVRRAAGAHQARLAAAAGVDARLARRLRAAAGRRDELLKELDYGESRRVLAYSVIGRLGRAIAPVMAPCGFDWKISTSLVGAFAAKEVFVSQMGVVYSVGESGQESGQLRQKLRAGYTPLQGFCIMLFCLITLPCVATLAATWRESGSVRWALLQAGGLTALAYAVTAAVYQLGRLLS